MAYTTIDKPSDYFNTLTWTGDGSSSRNITGLVFQPDWVWGKCRNAAVSHAVYDSVRGASNLINTNTDSAEGTNPALNAFISDGFTVNSDSYLNLNSNTYVAWNWLASNTTASNTDGSITSTVSANTTAGFSIVSFTSTGSTSTVGHGLGVTPDVYIIKNRSAVEPWFVYTTKIDGSLDYLRLNQTNGKVDFGLSAPTSSVFSTDNGSTGNSIIAYCFAEKQGYSKFGSYVGNGSSSGSYIHLGFKPTWLMAKRTDSADEWIVQDGVRAPFNEVDVRLFANSNGAEQTNGFGDVDFLAQGFKWRTNSATLNASGGSYFYMAFAENPFVTSTGVPATAR